MIKLPAKQPLNQVVETQERRDGVIEMAGESLETLVDVRFGCAAKLHMLPDHCRHGNLAEETVTYKVSV